MNDPQAVTESPRRKFLRGAALAATSAATLGFPNVVKAQGLVYGSKPHRSHGAPP